MKWRVLDKEVDIYVSSSYWRGMGIKLLTDDIRVVDFVPDLVSPTSYT